MMFYIDDKLLGRYEPTWSNNNIVIGLSNHCLSLIICSEFDSGPWPGVFDTTSSMA